MSLPLQPSIMSAFSLGGTNYLALLKTFSLKAENEVFDGAGVTGVNEFNVPVKQTQSVDFTLFENNSVPLNASNLDVSVFTIGGTNFLAALRSADISMTMKTVEGSPGNAAYRIAMPRRRGIEVRTDLMVFTDPKMADAILSGTQASFSVVIAITVFGEAISLPMVMTSGEYRVDRDEIQIESATFKLQGTPTGPSDSTFIGVGLVGAGALILVADTGAKTYSNTGGQVSTIERMGIRVPEAGLVEVTGRLVSQGALTVAGP